MKASQVLIKPRVTEKVNTQMEKHNRFTFVVDKRANKIEIKDAVEEFYNVKVAQVNTMVNPAKSKSRFTKDGLVKGRQSSIKKAIVTLAEGEHLDIFEY